MYVNLLKEGESKYGVLQPKEKMLHSIFSFDRAYFSFLVLWKMRSYELIQPKRCSKNGGSAPKISYDFKMGAHPPLHDTPAFMASF